MTDTTFDNFTNVIVELLEYPVPQKLIDKIYNYAEAQNSYISELLESLSYYESG